MAEDEDEAVSIVLHAFGVADGAATGAGVVATDTEVAMEMDGLAATAAPPIVIDSRLRLRLATSAPLAPPTKPPNGRHDSIGPRSALACAMSASRCDGVTAATGAYDDDDDEAEPSAPEPADRLEDEGAGKR